jgi:uncharacterized membrane protein required for colicin V production
MYVTLFDILILMALFLGGLLGFYRGLFRQAAATVSLYVAFVVATVSYRGLGRVLMDWTGQSALATDVLAFFVLLVLLLIILILITRDLLEHIDHDRMGIWYNLTGMIVGVLNAAIVGAVVIMVIRSASAGDDWIGYAGFQAFLRRQVRRSWMAFVLQPFMRLLLAIVQPWLFGYDLPPLLRNVF